MPSFEGTRPFTLRDYQPEARKRPKRHSSDFEDYTLSNPQCLCHREESMWRAVITQVLTDALSYSSKAETVQERFEAIDWLCGMSRDYRLTCENAGLDALWVHRKVQHFLTSHVKSCPQWPGAEQLQRARQRYQRNHDARKSWEETIH